MIKIFGHRSPDADSTGSPLIWEWYLNHVVGKKAAAKLLGEPSNEAKFMLEQWGFDQPEIITDVSPEDEVVIVDTNNIAELPPSINSAKILEIIDHHLLQGGLATRTPIKITVRPVACTATVMHDLMGDDAARMPLEIKGLMLTCILSDTLAFRSPTTTHHDRAIAEALATDIGVDIPSFAGKMFEAKSDVSGFSDSELLRLDSKQYEIGGKLFRISVLETTSPSVVLSRKESLMESMKTVANEDGIDQVLLFVVDILNEEATMLVPNALVKTVAEKSFSAQVSGDAVVLPGIMSRKKQIIPNLAF